MYHSAKFFILNIAFLILCQIFTLAENIWKKTSLLNRSFFGFFFIVFFFRFKDIAKFNESNIKQNTVLKC